MGQVQMEQVEVGELETPIGTVRVAVRAGAVCAVGFGDRFDEALVRRFGVLPPRVPGAAQQLRRVEAYFAGDPGALAGLVVDTGGTDFQRAVWAALRDIPPGGTRSYGQIAAAVGRPRAVRAVGACNARNALALVIPCHRVLGAAGDLRGYAWGEDRKAWLLAHERAAVARAAA